MQELVCPVGEPVGLPQRRAPVEMMCLEHPLGRPAAGTPVEVGMAELEVRGRKHPGRDLSSCWLPRAQPP